MDQSTLAQRNSSLLKNHRVHKEWYYPLSGVHSIMMEKLTQAGEGGGVHAHPLSLYLPSRTKLWCTLHLRGQIHSPYFYSTPTCTLWLKHWTELDGRNQDGGKNVFFLFMVVGLAFVVGDGWGLDLLVHWVEDLVLLVPKTFTPLNCTVFFCLNIHSFNSSTSTWTFTLIQ